MAKSRNNKTHKERLNNFKNKTKQKMSVKPEDGMPEVINQPTWAGDATIEMTGVEFEILNNALSAAQESAQVMQAIMSRNIVSGVIGMDFQKLDPATLQYAPMSDEEKAPYLKKFEDAIAAIKSGKRPGETNEAPTESNVPVDDQPVAPSTDAPSENQAKVVKL